MLENMNIIMATNGIGKKTFAFLPVWVLKLISVNLLLYRTATYK